MPDGSGLVQGLPPSARPADVADRLIVALDVETVEDALSLVTALDGLVSFFKIGFRLQIAEGFDRLVAHLHAAEKKIFLDAKMYDIPQTVETAVKAAAARGVSFITVHGDETILRAAARGRGDTSIKVFAVTVLTSLDDAALKDMGYAVGARDLVRLRARTAVACRCDGIIASADDDPDAIRALAGDDRLLIATPGIRVGDGPLDDQRRTATAAQAIESGADFLVVGRPIICAANPAAAARSMIEQMKMGQRQRDAARKPG